MAKSKAKTKEAKAAKSSKREDVKKVRKELMFPLNEAEISKKANVIAQKLKYQAGQERELREVTKGFRDRISQVEAEIVTLRDQIIEANEPRTVTCELRKNYDKNQLEYWYDGKCMETKDMTEADRQQDLKLDSNPDKKAPAKDETPDDVKQVIKEETNKKTKRSALDGVYQ